MGWIVWYGDCLDPVIVSELLLHGRILPSCFIVKLAGIKTKGECGQDNF